MTLCTDRRTNEMKNKMVDKILYNGNKTLVRHYSKLFNVHEPNEFSIDMLILLGQTSIRQHVSSEMQISWGLSDKNLFCICDLTRT